jgi:hypothetical protein
MLIGSVPLLASAASSAPANLRSVCIHSLSAYVCAHVCAFERCDAYCAPANLHVVCVTCAGVGMFGSVTLVAPLLTMCAFERCSACRAPASLHVYCVYIVIAVRICYASMRISSACS